MQPERARAWRQLAVSYAVTNGLVFALSRPPLRSYGLDEVIGALFLLATIVSVRADDDETARYGVDLAGVFPGRAGDPRSLVRAVVEGVPSALREFGVAVSVALVVLPVYAWLWPRFNPTPAVRTFVLDAPHVRDLLTQLLAVALTEEMYFRGYVQTRVADALGIRADGPLAQRARAMVVPVVIASTLFALTHVTVAFTLPRGVVFFPGLIFGLLRAWRGGIGAAVFFHAISNVFEAWLEGR